MNTSLSWIKAYVPDLDVTAQEYTDAMTLSGTKVEGFEVLDADLEKIVIGQIDKIEKHPDADKLVVCQVNVGTETVQIVTGAKNVFEGAKVPVVLDGGRVAGSHDGKVVEGGIKIKKGKLRGVESFGMMCSIEELGSTTDMYPEAPENGIYIFEEDAVVGSSAIEALGRNDVVFEYEVTSNRVDCFSVVGIAREAAATFRKEFCPPVVTETGNDEDVNDYIKVTVENTELCPRYCARVVKNVKIGPSPRWMQRRLASVGIRPINNLVDITNYVMEEYGQPMHAYDLSTIAGNEIVVKTAKAGEKFVTLDGQEREMDESVLMICDGEKSVGIAGIMGGENSMITDDVQNVLFEAACFDGTNIRKSSKKVGLRTDASGKFEILQIFKEVVLKNSQTFQIGNFIIIEMQVFHIFDNLRKPCADGVAGFHRVIPVKGVKNYRFITVHVLKVALHHRQFVKIGHEGKIPRFHGFSSAFSIMGSDTGRRMKGCPLPV